MNAREQVAFDGYVTWLQAAIREAAENREGANRHNDPEGSALYTGNVYAYRRALEQFGMALLTVTR